MTTQQPPHMMASPDQGSERKAKRGPKKSKTSNGPQIQPGMMVQPGMQLQPGMIPHQQFLTPQQQQMMMQNPQMMQQMQHQQFLAAQQQAQQQGHNIQQGQPVPGQFFHQQGQHMMIQPGQPGQPGQHFMGLQPAQIQQHQMQIQQQQAQSQQQQAAQQQAQAQHQQQHAAQQALQQQQQAAQQAMQQQAAQQQAQGQPNPNHENAPEMFWVEEIVKNISEADLPNWTNRRIFQELVNRRGKNWNPNDPEESALKETIRLKIKTLLGMGAPTPQQPGMPNQQQQQQFPPGMQPPVQGQVAVQGNQPMRAAQQQMLAMQQHDGMRRQQMLAMHQSHQQFQMMMQQQELERQRAQQQGLLQQQNVPGQPGQTTVPSPPSKKRTKRSKAQAENTPNATQPIPGQGPMMGAVQGNSVPSGPGTVQGNIAGNPPAPGSIPQNFIQQPPVPMPGKELVTCMDCKEYKQIDKAQFAELDKQNPFKCSSINMPCNVHSMSQNVVGWNNMKPGMPHVPHSNSPIQTPSSLPDSPVKKRPRRNKKVSPSPGQFNNIVPITGTICTSPIIPSPPNCKIVLVIPAIDIKLDSLEKLQELTMKHDTLPDGITQGSKKRLRSNKRIYNDNKTPSIPSLESEKKDNNENTTLESASITTQSTPVSIFTPSGRKSRSKAAKEQIALIEASGEKGPVVNGKRNSTSTPTATGRSRPSRPPGKKASTLAALAAATVTTGHPKENAKDNKIDGTPKRRASSATVSPTNKKSAEKTPKNKTELVPKTPSRKKSTVGMSDDKNDVKDTKDEEKEEEKKEEAPIEEKIEENKEEAPIEEKKEEEDKKRRNDSR